MSGQAIPLDEAMPGFRRPQQSVDDLVAEYEAWVKDERDGHDKAVLTYREDMAARTEVTHHVLLRFLHPEYVSAEEMVSPYSQDETVALILEGRLATARGRRKEYEAMEERLEKQIAEVRSKIASYQESE